MKKKQTKKDEETAVICQANPIYCIRMVPGLIIYIHFIHSFKAVQTSGYTAKLNSVLIKL